MCMPLYACEDKHTHVSEQAVTRQPQNPLLSNQTTDSSKKNLTHTINEPFHEHKNKQES